MTPYIAIYLIGVLAIIVAAAAFISDLVVHWWQRWDDVRRIHRKADVREMKRVLDLP